MPDILFEIAENAAPDDASVGMLKMRDGIHVRFARFPAAGRPLKGTIIIIPGRNECIEKYFETIADLSRRGFGTAMIDLRGQGGSDRLIRDPLRGYVESFDQYVGDMEEFFEEIVLPDCRPPYYVLGHSTGSLVALLAAPRLVTQVRRMVLIAPLLRFSGRTFSTPALKRIASLLFALGLGTVYMSGGPPGRAPTPFAANRLTTDPIRYARNQQLFLRYPRLAAGGPTAAWIRAACKATEKVLDPEFAAKIRIPTLLIAAGADQVVSTPAIESFARRLRVGALLTIDGARHELLQEADVYREQVLAAFDAFVPGTDDVLV